MDTMYENYVALADAIVVQAGVDYLKALRILDLNRGKEGESQVWFKARCTVFEVRAFFKSKLHDSLTDADGRRTLVMLNRTYRGFRESGDLDQIKNLTRTAS